MGRQAELRWTKSSRSYSNDCLEWALAADESRIHVRDSKNPTGPVLTFTRSEWAAFIAGAKLGEADL
jgi:hypothetical protein